MSSLDDDKTYNYKDGWFKGIIDLSSVNQGNYILYIKTYNYDTGYQTKTYFTNIGYLEMPRRVKGNNKSFAFNVDFSYLGSPMILEIRDHDLLSYDIPSSMDPMYNFFNELKLENNKLYIKGTSHVIGESYATSDDIKREIVFENINTFERFSYNLGYIDNGPYKIELAVSDNKDKTRAWFEKEIDLTDLTLGKYAIYIKTTSNNKTYYGELIDVSYTDFTTINSSKYKFQRIDNKRLRLELEIS